jgi:mRNA-degrading endonuclease RelE of RelBE toxin-antitoxin system
MSYSIKTIPPFDKQLKRLIKKYASLKSEFKELVQQLYIEPNLGENLGNNCYKIRITINSKNKGKSGGARIITNIVYVSKTIYLVSVYDKSEKSTISKKELNDLLKYIEKVN